MKIISKWKDYYDYLSGIYGIDDIVVYDRRKNVIKHEFDSDSRADSIEFHICNKMYTVFEYKGKFYHFYEDILELDKLLKRDGNSTILSYWRDGKVSTWYKKERWWKEHNGSTDLNKKERQPVLLKNHYGVAVPILSSYDFHKVLSADEIYKEVYAFISWMKDNPEIPNKQTDIEKLDSHGFDRKKSFRHRK